MKTTKIVSGLMAMAMAVMSLGVTASAADSVSVKVGTATAKAGETFSVDVELANVPSTGLSSIDFAINYDSAALNITDVKLGKIGDTGAAAQEGDLGDTLFSWYDNGKQIVIVWATGLTDSQYWVKSDGVLVTLTGTVAAGAADGTYKLTVGGADRATYPGASDKASAYLSAVGASSTTDYTPAADDGAVQVGGATTTETPDDGNVKWGDADVSGIVDVSDAVLVCRFALSDPDVTITAQGQKNADVTHDGKITSDDSIKIVNFIAGIIKEEDLAK